MRPRIHAAARRRDRRQILLGACCSPVSCLNLLRTPRDLRSVLGQPSGHTCEDLGELEARRAPRGAENRPKRAK